MTVLDLASTSRFVRASITAGEFTANLVTIPNVELIEVGEDWETSTGNFTWDEADLLSAIESQADPSIRAPIIKLGHSDPRFGGQPAFGRIENLRVDNNGQTLVGDLVGVPAWLAAVMPTAYPRRSIEGWFNYCSPGPAGSEKWPFVLTGVALLGDRYPAINTLEDLQILWGETPPPMEGVDVEEQELVAATDNGYIRAMRRADMVSWIKTKRGEEVTAAAGQPGGVKAASSIDDVRRAFYDSLSGPEQYWWWIRQVLVNPFQLVVDDDDGGLFLIDVSVDGSDNITFGEPQPVKVEYVAATSSNFAEMHKQGQIVAANWGDRVTAGAKDKNNNEEEQGIVLTDDALRALGLQPGATEQQISEAILARAQGGDGNGGEGDGGGDGGATTTTEPGGGTTTTEPGNGGDGGTTTTEPATTTPAPTTTTPAPTTQPGSTTSTDLPVAATTQQQQQQFTAPPGTILVDAEQWALVQKGAADGSRVAAAAAQQERDRTMESAVMAGKFPRSRIEHYQQAWAADPEGTRILINSLPDGLVPVTERGSSAGETDPGVEAAQYPDTWKQDRRVRAMAQATATRVKVVND